MAKSKPNPFAKLKNTSPKPIKASESKTKVEVVTKVRKKVGRPSAFDEPQSRLTADIPSSTLKEMQRRLPDSPYKSQAQMVHAALLDLFKKMDSK